MTTTLCGASWYNQKYYLNPAFEKLPEAVRDELQIMAVAFTEDVGGVFTIEFGEDRLPHFSVLSAEGDPRFDEIGAELKIRKLRREKEDLLVRITLFYRIFVLGESAEKAAEGLEIEEIMEQLRTETAVRTLAEDSEDGSKKNENFDDTLDGTKVLETSLKDEEPYLSPFERLSGADVSFVPLWPDDLEDET